MSHVAAVAAPARGAGATPVVSKGAERVLLALAFMPLLALRVPSDLPASDRTLGAVLWLLCILPGLIYVGQHPSRRPPIPFFPLIGVVYGMYYALPAMSGAINLAYNPYQVRITWLDPAHDIRPAIEAALQGWMATLAGYGALAFVYRPRMRVERPWPVAPLVPWVVRLVIGGLAIELALLVLPIPTALRGALTFAASLSRFAIALLLVLRVRGRLSRREDLLVTVALPLQIILILASGSISNVFLFVLMLLLANWMGGGRIRSRWLLAGVMAALLLVTLKGVLVDYRRQAWFAGVELSIPERTVLMTRLVSAKVEERGVVGAVSHGWEAAVSRSATLDLLADVVRRTPREIPYWGGATYVSLIGFAVPRVLWPTKPEKTLGQDFGHRYTYLDNWDRWTSVNLPFLVEFYANFGTTGVIVGMFLTGLLYRLFDAVLNRRGQSTVRSLAAVSILIPLLNVESDFSLVFGGMFLNALAYFAVLRFLRMQTKTARVSGNTTPIAGPRQPRLTGSNA